MEPITLGEILRPLGITLALFLGFTLLFFALSSLTATALKMLSRVNLVLLLASSLLGLTIGTFAGASRESVIGQVIVGLFAVLGTGGLLYVVIKAQSTQEQKKLVAAMLTMFSIAILLGAYYGGWSRIMVESYLPTGAQTEVPAPAPTIEPEAPEEIPATPEGRIGVQLPIVVPTITMFGPIPGIMPTLKYYPVGQIPDEVMSIVELLNSDVEVTDKEKQLVNLLWDSAFVQYFDPDTNKLQLSRWGDIKTNVRTDLISQMARGQARYTEFWSALTISSKESDLMNEFSRDLSKLELSEIQQK